MTAIAFRLSCLALLALSSCGKPAADNSGNAAAANQAANDLVSVPEDNDAANLAPVDSPNAAAPAVTADWAGRWTGPEGLFLDIEPADPGKVKLTIKDNLDSKGDVYSGTVSGEAISFERAGKTEIIRAGKGSETGFKYLADKENCLIVQAGKEGYCR